MTDEEKKEWITKAKRCLGPLNEIVSLPDDFPNREKLAFEYAWAMVGYLKQAAREQL